ncbi:MAG: FtsX-like permease family protein [Bacteroidales bacterium]|nr:FtsX-like permease family protein [Bacteroidales bacterium]
MKLLNFKVSIRVLFKDRISFLATVVGIVVSVASIFFTGIWILDEIFYEDCHENLDQIYQFSTVYNPNSNIRITQSTCFPLAEEMIETFPEVQKSFRSGQKMAELTIDNESFSTFSFCFIDPAALEVLSFKFVEGNPENALSVVNGIIISKEAQDKFFKGGSAVGKTLTMNSFGVEKEMVVTGVCKKPSNSQFNLDFYASYLSLKDLDENDSWVRLSCRTYGLINKGADIEKLEARMSTWFNEKDPETEMALKIKTLKYKRLREGNGATGGTKTLVINLTILLVFMFSMVILNYIILSSLRLKKRIKSMALLKIFGSSMANIRREYIVESLVYMLLFSVMSILLVNYLIDDFNTIFDKKLSIFSSSNHLIFFIVIILMIVISGVFPLMTRYFNDPVKLLLNNTKSEFSVVIKDKIPLALQLTGSLFMIVISLFYYSQYLLLDKMNIGYNKENLIEIYSNRDVQQKMDILRSRWTEIEGVENVSASMRPPWNITSVARNVSWENNKENTVFNGNFAGISYDYIKTMQGKIVQGSALTEDVQKNDGIKYIINEKAKGIMGLENPIGMKMSLLGDEGYIIGVVEDFYHQNFDEGISPLILQYGAGRPLNVMLVRLTPHNGNKKMAELKSVFEEILPDEDFNWNYVEDCIDMVYLKKERLERNLVIIFAIAIIFICCIGLFALSLYLTLKKEKNIAIRKIHGATKWKIIMFFVKEYIIIELVAMVLAFPLAYLFLRNWLNNFAVKVELTPWLFILAAVIMFVILLLVLLYAIIKAVVVSPTVVLRNS